MGNNRGGNQRGGGGNGGNQGDAHAPYNFVPLNDQVLAHGDDTLDEAMPSHDRFHEGRHTGHFAVTLTTETPLYIRGMLTTEQARNPEAHKNRADFFSINGTPVIPGSSLRGMLRSLYEIVTWGKLHRMSQKPLIYFRAVAAEVGDPLKAHYDQCFEKLGKHIRAGYLIFHQGNWFIRPASKFVKLKTEDLDWRVNFNDPNFQPSYTPVLYESLGRSGGARATERYRARRVEQGEGWNGYVVVSGNMLETNIDDVIRPESPRKRVTLVLELMKDAQAIPIDRDAVRDYIDGRSDFLKEAPFHPERGVLVPGRPVFYYPPQGNEKAVRLFGHSPFFRIPATREIGGKQRAVTPFDLLPDDHVDVTTYDMADAVFGHVNSDDPQAKQGTQARAYTSRVSITHATTTHDPNTIYDAPPGGVTPKVLGSPSGSAFNMYVEGGKPYADEAAKLRGHKLYWRQNLASTSGPGFSPPADEIAKDQAKAADKQQLTRMRPVRRGVTFTFKVYFENLSNAELGALAWVLTLPGSDAHRHMLGMGKPFGMGQVRLTVDKLVLTDRASRYARLFDGNGWHTGQELADPQGYVSKFETHMLAELKRRGLTLNDFRAHPRMEALSTMLSAALPAGNFSYMDLEEYGKRRPLPSALQIKQRSRR